mgnify:CR=1 FL=1
MSKHTVGPWFTSDPDGGGGILIKPIPGQVVAQCDELPEMEANARLIAAAPELLEALETAKQLLETVEFRHLLQMCPSINTAIAKAKGEA